MEQKYIKLILLKMKKVTFRVFGQFWPRTTQVWPQNEQYLNNERRKLSEGVQVVRDVYYTVQLV